MSRIEVDLNTETIEFLIEKIREFQTRDDVTFDDEPSVDDTDWTGTFSANFAGDPAYQELKNNIDDLEPDQQVTLVALMWVGRGDFSPEEWQDALTQAGDSWTEHTSDYLIGTALLADYLGEGLAQLKSDDDEEDAA